VDAHLRVHVFVSQVSTTAMYSRSVSREGNTRAIVCIDERAGKRSTDMRHYSKEG